MAAKIFWWNEWNVLVVRLFFWFNGNWIIYSILCLFYDPPNEVGGSLCFCLVRPASVRPGGKKNMVLKHVLGGFDYVLGVFGDFDFCPSVRPSVRAVDGLCFVQRTCPRVLRFGTWNQFEMNEYILKLCTFYFERSSRSSVCLRGVWTCMFYM